MGLFRIIHMTLLDGSEGHQGKVGYCELHKEQVILNMPCVWKLPTKSLHLLV